MGPSELGGISRVPRRVGGTAGGVGGRASLGWKRAGLQAMGVIAGGWLETTRFLAERAFCPYARRPFLGAGSAGVPCPQSSDRSLPRLAPPTWVTGSGAGLTASPVGPWVTVCAGQPRPLQASRRRGGQVGTRPQAVEHQAAPYKRAWTARTPAGFVWSPEPSIVTRQCGSVKGSVAGPAGLLSP